MKDSVIEKPWGKEELLEVNEHYMVKRLTMFAGHRCSLQYHLKKKETIYVLSGLLRIIQGIDENHLNQKELRAGEVVTIPPGTVHRMEGIEESVYLEASTPDLDDVIRLKDDYKRVSN